MISPPPGASSGGGSRRARYTRSPSGGPPSSKRSKPSSSTADPYDRNHGSGSDQNRLYTSICVKNMNPKISDLGKIRWTFGTLVRRLLFSCLQMCAKCVIRNSRSMEPTQWKSIIRIKNVLLLSISRIAKMPRRRDMRRQVLSGRICEWRWNRKCLVRCSVLVFSDRFRVYYRRTVPAEQPLNSASPNERSPPHRRHRRSSTRSPSPPPPPPVSSRGRYSSSSRHQRAISPPRSPPPMRSSRPPRRPYSPYIPLPPDLADYVSSAAPTRTRPPSSPSPVRRHHHKHSSKSKRSRSPNSHRSASGSPVPRAHADADANGQSEPTRTLLVENLDRDISESKLKDIFGRYGTIDESNIPWLQRVIEKKCSHPSRFLFF